MDDDASVLEIRAVGPATTNGRLPLSELARLAGEFQSTLERIALALQGGRHSGGRRPREVVDAVRLELVGLRTGSAVLDVARADAPTAAQDLLVQSLDVFEAGTRSVLDQGELPEAFTLQVLDGLIRLAGGVGEGHITSVTFSRSGRSIVVVDDAFRAAVRSVRRRATRDRATLVGILRMGDFAPSALRCRIDTLDSSVLCTFDEDLKDAVLAAMDRTVMASGVGEFYAGGAPRSMDLTHLEVLPEQARRTLAELTAAQGVAAYGSDTDFGLADAVDDQDFAAFMSGALSSRTHR